MKSYGVVTGKDIEWYKNIFTKSLSDTALDSQLQVIKIQLKQGNIICISSDELYNSVNPSKPISYFDNKLTEKLQELHTIIVIIYR